MGGKTRAENILFGISIVVIFLALFNVGLTIYKVGGFDKLTGYATDTGTANLSIVSQATINFTTENINWGVGAVNESLGLATIDSEGNITNGNWTAVYQGLTLINNGNCNVQLNFTTSNVASTFIGGSSNGGPTYKLKITDNETGSCSSGLASTYTEATGASQPGCNNFTYYDTNDTVDVDVQIQIPQDALPGAKGSVITATATVL